MLLVIISSFIDLFSLSCDIHCRKREDCERRRRIGENAEPNSEGASVPKSTKYKECKRRRILSAHFELGFHLPHSINCLYLYPLHERRDSVVGIATTYGLDDREVGIRIPVGSRIFSSPRRPGRLWSPSSLLSNEYRGLFPRVLKWPGREAAHSPPASTQVKKMWIYTSTPPYVFTA
jgi:hypothetical protein